MRYIIVSALVIIFSQVAYANESFAVKAAEQQKIGVAIVCVGDRDTQLDEVITTLCKDLAFSGQFSTAERELHGAVGMKHIKRLFKEGFPLALFVNTQIGGQAIEWRLYDTISGTMILGKKYAKRGAVPRVWAHAVSDALWPVLTTKPGFFSTRITYCRSSSKHLGKKIICVADYDGTHEQVLVSSGALSIAPRWNNDPKNPLVFYSEYTKKNMRLMAVDMKRRTKVTSDFDGINMLPSFSPDGSQVVYCASKGQGSCQLYYCAQGIFQQLTHNDGNNVSPTFDKEGKTVYFCSDFETGRPQLYACALANHTTSRLTTGGYCASPHYNPQRDQLVYGKLIEGQMQLFLYDVKTQKHTQLTHDVGSKEESSWSPCGNYILFSHEVPAKKARLAIQHLATGDRHYIAGEETAAYTYPSWSPFYQQFPLVLRVS